LLVYSIAARSTFERIRRFRDQITRVKDSEDVPLMLVGNKCDRLTDREVSRDEGAMMAKQMRCEFTETSAKTCVNVERSFYNVVRMTAVHPELQSRQTRRSQSAQSSKEKYEKQNKE
jgi:GTPase KRas protein